MKENWCIYRYKNLLHHLSQVLVFLSLWPKLYQIHTFHLTLSYLIFPLKGDVHTKFRLQLVYLHTAVPQEFRSQGHSFEADSHRYEKHVRGHLPLSTLNLEAVAEKPLTQQPPDDFLYRQMDRWLDRQTDSYT